MTKELIEQANEAIMQLRIKAERDKVTEKDLYDVKILLCKAIDTLPQLVGYGEIIDAIKTQTDIIKKLISRQRIVNLDEAIAYYEKLHERLNRDKATAKPVDGIDNILPTEKEAQKYCNGAFGFDSNSSDKEHGFISGYDWTINLIKHRLQQITAPPKQ